MAKQPFSMTGNGLTELRQRLFFVLLGLIIYRFGVYIPVPGVDTVKVFEYFYRTQQNTLAGMFNMFSGGALWRMSIFALGIMPYISASIIMQLMATVTPSLAELKKEGESGQRKITQYTRYATLALALFQSVGMTKYIIAQGWAFFPSSIFYVLSVLSLTTGTIFLMWLGEQMTERGVGNGISLLIFSSIASGIPSAIGRTFSQVRDGEMSSALLLLVVGLIAGITAFVVYVERAQRRITVNYAKRQKGNKQYAAQQSHLPLKINMAGVIPPIFASAILMVPATLGRWFGSSPSMQWLADISLALSPDQPLYLVFFSIAIVFFCFFYASLVFNPRETADRLKKDGAFIPGIRPGAQTAQYIDDIMTRLTVIGAIYITAVSLLPTLFLVTWHVPFYFGGTSLLIVVVVVMDFMAQIQSHLMSNQYAHLLRKANLKAGSANMSTFH